MLRRRKQNAGTENDAQGGNSLHDADTGASAAESEAGDQAEISSAGDIGADQTGDNIEELKKKAELADDYLDRLQRLHAEFDNYRKRTKREEATLFVRAIEDVVSEMVEVLDVFDQALDENLYANVPKAYRQGIDIVRRKINEVLYRRGLARITAQGEAFDPNLHEAISVEENKDIPNNTVMEELKPGYMLGERLLRPSMVKVSRGGPERLRPEQTQTNHDSSTDKPESNN